MNKMIAAAAAALTLFSASASFAAMMKPMPKSAMHTTASKSVYVCKTCKAYYSPMQAKKMKYMDSMGHKLTKMSKVPAGYMDGSKMKM